MTSETQNFERGCTFNRLTTKCFQPRVNLMSTCTTLPRPRRGLPDCRGCKLIFETDSVKGTCFQAVETKRCFQHGVKPMSSCAAPSSPLSCGSGTSHPPPPQPPTTPPPRSSGASSEKPASKLKALVRLLSFPQSFFLKLGVFQAGVKFAPPHRARQKPRQTLHRAVVAQAQKTRFKLKAMCILFTIKL